MAPLTPFDRDEWTERHPAPAVWAKPHPHKWPRRCVLAVLVVVAIAVAVAAWEVSFDWVRAS